MLIRKCVRGDATATRVHTFLSSMELLRLAMPRRLYTQSHVDYVGEIAAVVKEIAHSLHGYRIVSAPTVLRHFTARFEPVGVAVHAARA